MCTLALAVGADRRWPLVVAANRDERLGRPSEGWAIRDPAGAGPRYAAPRDLQAGGTWIGLSAASVFAGVTNYHASMAWYPDPARRSRGELVALALAHPSASAAREALSSLPAARYNPFHLAVADARSAFVWWYDGEAAGLEPLGAGLHVITENAWDGRCPRAELVRARWPVEPALPRLRQVLTIHGPALTFGASTCIHMDPAYGTRSSAVIRLAARLESSELYTADGPPCTFLLEDRSALLRGLAPG
ncbi:MAG TPA: NRDE family protein [Anaeromyxobacteraceae bacterium]|nr:NRDE family protein [Anaeromyxobacteraceae bacterium]